MGKQTTLAGCGLMKMVNVVLDLGANIECNDQTVDFAELGLHYINLFSLKKNLKYFIKWDQRKGTEMLKTASKRLRQLNSDTIYNGYIRK